MATPRHRATSSGLRLVWVYPDLLSTYGDRGNLLVLQRRARLRGIDTEAVSVHADQPVPRSGDIYLMGGGEDLPQILAARRLRADGGLAAAASDGAVLLAVCAGYQVIGEEFGGVEGEPVPGLGILDIRSGRVPGPSLVTPWWFSNPVSRGTPSSGSTSATISPTPRRSPRPLRMSRIPSPGTGSPSTPPNSAPITW